MAQARASSIVLARQRGGLEHDVQVAEPPAAPVGPALEGLVAELGQEPVPRGTGRVEVGGAQFDVVQTTPAHRSFRSVFALRVVVVRLKRAAPARLANTVSVLDPFGHDQ